MAEAVIFPAGNKIIIERRAIKSLASGCWVVEPLREKRKENILTARAIIQGAGSQLLVKVMHPLQEDMI